MCEYERRERKIVVQGGNIPAFSLSKAALSIFQSSCHAMFFFASVKLFPSPLLSFEICPTVPSLVAGLVVLAVCYCCFLFSSSFFLSFFTTARSSTTIVIRCLKYLEENRQQFKARARSFSNDTNIVLFSVMSVL